MLGVTIRRLDRKRLGRYLPDLCLIDGKAFPNNAWHEENFSCGRPKKLELSLIVLHRRRTVGYLIASRYGRARAHIHRFVVAHNFRRRGIGTRLLRRFEEKCSEMRIAEITLESTRSRYGANRFYDRMGFLQISGSKLVMYLTRRGKRSLRRRYSGLFPSGHVVVYSK